jgi:hypothetical protein
MVYNDPNNPQAARIAQDIEGRPAKLSPGEFHAGRGVRFFPAVFAGGIF